MKTIITERPDGSRRVSYCFKDEVSLTRQEFKDECDLELTIKRFSRTDEGRQALAKAQGFIGGRFEDVSDIPDYRTALDQVQRAKEAFERLPAMLRKRFDNDAALFLDFVDNPANLDELISLGLAKPKVESPEVPRTS